MDDRRTISGSGAIGLGLIRRHVERCPRCRAEASENERMIRLLRQTERQSAPPSLLPAVMARIAAEREVSDAAGAQPTQGNGPSARKADRRRTFPGPGDRGQMGPAPLVLTLFCGWVGFLGAAESFLGSVHLAVAGADSAMSIAQFYVSEVLVDFYMRYAAIPVGVEPYVTGLFWSVVGLGLAIPMLVNVRTV